MKDHSRWRKVKLGERFSRKTEKQQRRGKRTVDIGRFSEASSAPLAQHLNMGKTNFVSGQN
jgi:hypothetical protein